MTAGIAIVGIAFRFPGDLCDERGLWQALKEGRDLVSQVPSERWAVDELQHPKRGEPGRSVTFSAGVLSQIGDFDAAFFGISPREAASLDPQQRLLLELAWEALENAGKAPSSLRGSDCAVYVGISSLDYGTRGLDDLASLGAHSMTGNTLSIAANRLSYFLDWHGPSVAVDTACSSSLVALHQACNSLRTGEASSALVGGVNLLLHPYPFVGFTKASMLSAGGRCRAFDASGDGYVRAEGGAVVFLKPLARALADGDDIQAVILATGVNADGARKTGLTIPSSEGQAELMRTVLARSGLSPRDIDFFEAHGTGTAVGDPIEAAAIGSVYGRHRPTGQPLPIGSVKTNLGHLESASGLAGLVKAVLALKHKGLPPSLHWQQPNRNIDFAGLNLEVASTFRELARSDRRPLVAGINSFGFGGANAHMLVQEYCPQGHEVHSDARCPAPPLFLSARTTEALRDLAGRYAELLTAKSSDDFYDIAYAAAYRRERLEKRLAVRADTVDQIRKMLASWAQGETVDPVILEESHSPAGGVAFVYSGNGSQWAGMAQRLIAECARFRDLLAGVDDAMHAVAGFSVLAELHAEDSASRLDDTAVAQPLLFAIQVALTLWFREQGLEPFAVVGHSVGEVAAAWAAGALDLHQAIRVICARSIAQAVTRGTGRMATVGLSETAMNDILAELGSDVEIAGINSPTNVTLSGCLTDLERIRRHVEAKGLFFRLLDLDYAFHSRQMDFIENRLTESLRELAPTSSGATTFLSTVTGDVLRGEALGAEYWWLNIRRPVRFAEAIAKLLALRCRVFIEIGPHAILQRYVGECFNASGINGRILPTLRRNDDGLARIQEVVLRACLLGAEPQREKYFPRIGRPVRLPNYPWQRERYWHPTTSEGHALFDRRRAHPLLGWRLTEVENGWENTVDPATVPWLVDHQVGGAMVLPAAAFAEMALAAAREWQGGQHFLVEQLDILTPVVFDGEHARSLRFSLEARDGGFQIRGRQRLSDDEWTLHAVGRLLGATSSRPPTVGRLTSLPETAGAIDRETHYRLASTVGLDYGPCFRSFGCGHLGDHLLEGTLDVPEDVQRDATYLLHPALLDVCFQSLVHFLRPEIEAGQGLPLLPVKIGRLDLHRRASISHFRASLLRRGARSVLADFELLDAAGNIVAGAYGCRFRAASVVAHRQPSPPLCWRTDLRLQPHPVDQQTIQLLSTSELVAHSLSWLANEETTLRRITWFKETLPLFDALALSFAYSAFQELFVRRPEWLQHALSTPDAPPYLRWLANCLKQEEWLRENEGVWYLQASDIPSAEQIWQTLLRDAPACWSELVLLGRIGRHLPDLLLGELEGRTFLEGLLRSPAAETRHDDDPAYLGTRLAAQNILIHLARAHPGHRRLRVLEVSCGGSEWPRGLLGELPEDRLDYVLAQFDEETRLRQQAEFHDHANLIVAGIDETTWELASEEALPDVFDVVVLRHCAHQAQSPQAVLGQARRWLAQGGLLLLAERYPDWSADFLNGLDPRWWHEGPDQPLSSLMSPVAWQGALRDQQFSDIELLAESAADHLSEGAYLLLAKKPLVDAGPSPTLHHATWLLLVDSVSSPVADPLRKRLESSGQRVTITQTGNGRSAIDHNQAFLGRFGDVEHVVSLLGWAANVGDPRGNPATVLRLVQTLTTIEGPLPRLWLLTRGGALASGLSGIVDPNPLQAAVWGLGRTIMNEHPGLSCALIDMDCDLDAPETLARLENELLRPDGLNEVVLTPTARYSVVLRQDDPQTPASPEGHRERYRLDFRVPGQLRNLLWLPDPDRPLPAREIEVHPRAVGLNFRDVMYVMGLLPDEAVERGFAGASLGLEFSGVVARVGGQVHEFAPGDAVMGFGSACFASHVVTRPDAVASIPEGWSFEAAATVPTVFFTVYYALKHLADVQAGERVLIHGAAGGVGIAAIQLARHLGAEVFATAGSDEKRDFVRLLGADYVFDSRSLDFADEIFAITGGGGVDVVLNSLAGEAIRRNLRILKPFGRFLELGKRDFFENTPIGLRAFKDNISYYGIDADQLLTARPTLAARLFREVMALFRDGVLSPLPYRSFPSERVVDAFRVMQQSRHVGKVVVSLAGIAPVVKKHAEPYPMLRFARDTTWLVTGGLAGFGLESARWLADRGVGHLVLLGRRGPKTPGAQEALAALQAQGVMVQAIACDIADRGALRSVIERIQQGLPPLKGVLHAAMTIDDALIAHTDAPRMAAVFRPKLLGAWNLHELTRDIALEHFVLYSSLTAMFGNPGQASYVAANAALEGLAKVRQQMALPVTCIGWGPIADAGYLTRNTAVRDSLTQRLGAAPLTSAAALKTLDRLLIDKGGTRAVADFEWATLARTLPSARAARFSLLNRHAQGVGSAEDSRDFRVLIAEKSVDEVSELVRKLVTQEVAQILCISPERIEPNRSLHDLGMDSLMAVELALGMEQRFGIPLPVMMLSEGITVVRVTAVIVDKVIGKEAQEPPSVHAVSTLVEGLARQHGEQITEEDLERTTRDARSLAREGTRLIA